MAEEARRLEIPTGGVNALDEDTYSDNGGVPTSSALGRQIARNDRALHAMLRRTLVAQAWDIQDPPQLCRFHGVRIGPYPCPTTPWIKDGQWRLRIKPEANAVHTFIPFVTDLLEYSGPRDGLPAAWEHTDGGAGTEVTVGPLEVPLAYDFDPVPLSGVIVHSHVKSGSPTPGSVKKYDERKIQSTAASFVGIGSPSCTVIRLSNSVTGEIYMGWRDIIRVSTEDLASDTVHFWPPWDEEADVDNINLQWETQAIWSADLYSAVLREKPLSGNLGAI